MSTRRELFKGDAQRSIGRAQKLVDSLAWWRWEYKEYTDHHTHSTTVHKRLSDSTAGRKTIHPGQTAELGPGRTLGKPCHVIYRVIKDLARRARGSHQITMRKHEGGACSFRKHHHKTVISRTKAYSYGAAITKSARWHGLAHDRDARSRLQGYMRRFLGGSFRAYVYRGVGRAHSFARLHSVLGASKQTVQSGSQGRQRRRTAAAVETAVDRGLISIKYGG